LYFIKDEIVLSDLSFSLKLILDPKLFLSAMIKLVELKLESIAVKENVLLFTLLMTRSLISKFESKNVISAPCELLGIDMLS